MNDFKKYIREKERQFEARLKELESRNKYNSYIGQKLGTKTIIGIESKRIGSKIRTCFKWRCDCGIEGSSERKSMLNKIPKCIHRSKKK